MATTTVKLTAALRAQYQTLFDTCQIRSARAAGVEQAVERILANKARYAAVCDPLKIPWPVLAAIHHMESSLDFARHLHNGDPLTARTRQVPAGRPVKGDPPFTWEESAADALEYDGLLKVTDWSIPGILYCLEKFNGWGYRLHHPAVKSPYLWSGSNHYVAGKYVADGTWSDTAVSAQNGAATVLRRLAEKGELEAPSLPVDVQLAQVMGRKAALYAFNPNKVMPGGIALQHFLNTFPGIFLKEDGKLGPMTSEACRRIFGWYLKGDPRGST
jgi:lysozyme family protein